MSLRKVIFQGNVGSKDFREVDGVAYCNLSIAVDMSYTNRETNKKVDVTAWIRHTVTGAQAVAANQFVDVGNEVIAEGWFRIDPETGGPRMYQRKDGSAGAAYETRGIVHFCRNGGRPEVPQEDDIPF